MIMDDEHVNRWLKVLDSYQPKDVYAVEVTYVPKDAQLSADPNCFREIHAKSRRIDRVSDQHLHFISMLGKLLNIGASGEIPNEGNHLLYLRNPKIE